MIYGGENHIKIPKKWVKWLIIQILMTSLILILTKPVQATVYDLDVNSFTLTDHGNSDWGASGASPYLDAQDQPTNVISTPVINREHGDYSFEDLPSTTLSINNATLYVYAKNVGAGGSEGDIEFYVWNTTTWEQMISDRFQLNETASWQYYTMNLTTQLNTPAKVNAFMVYVISRAPFLSTPTLRIDHVFLRVDAEMPPPPPPPQDFVGDYFGTGIFIGGVIMMIYAPSWVAWKVKKVGVTPDTVETMGYAMLIFLLGLGLFLSYIYGSV